jgi:hypothetical protein
MNRRTALGSLAATTLTITAAPAAVEKMARQPYPPLDNMHAYLCAFHTVKKDPNIVVEAHHYCSTVNEDLHQCVVFDTNGKNARLLGVEYIIPDKVYRSLPDEEKKYYHPHSYEVISGLLIAPEMDKEAEKALMTALVTTWGKTWHTWPDPSTKLPMGEPLLMWAATKDGHVPDDRLAQRDKAFGIRTPDIRKARSFLGPVPQIDAPQSLDALGRQWTNDGPDERPKR